MNAFVLGMMYSTTNFVISKVTEQEDSVLTSVAAGTITGVMYKSTGGLILALHYYNLFSLLAGVRAVLMAGGVGAAFIGLFSLGQYLYNNRYKFLSYNTA